MCVVSMVYDFWKDRVPQPNPSVTGTCPFCGAAYLGLTHVCQSTVAQQTCSACGQKYTGLHLCPKATQWTPALTEDDVRRIIEDFHKSVKAAEVVDELTKQKDCVDPEKAKLKERVAELERLLAEIEKTAAKAKPGNTTVFAGSGLAGGGATAGSIFINNPANK